MTTFKLLSSIFILYILAGCEGPKFQASSDSKEFSGAILGGDLAQYSLGKPLEIDGNQYFYTKNQSRLSSDKKNEINSITFECKESIFGKSLGVAEIDGVSCKSKVNEIIESAKWQQLCSIHSFSPIEKQQPILLIRNNAFVEVNFDDDSKGYVSNLGLTLLNYKTSKNYVKCDKIPELVAKAKLHGYTSIGEMTNSKTLPRLPISSIESDENFLISSKCAGMHAALIAFTNENNIRLSDPHFEEGYRIFSNISIYILLSHGFKGKEISAPEVKAYQIDHFVPQTVAIKNLLESAYNRNGILINPDAMAQVNQSMNSCNSFLNSKGKTYQDFILRNGKSVYSQL